MPTDQERITNKAWRESRKQGGLCVDCRADAIPGRTQCLKCAEKRRARGRRYRQGIRDGTIKPQPTSGHTPPRPVGAQEPDDAYRGPHSNLSQAHRSGPFHHLITKLDKITAPARSRMTPEEYGRMTQSIRNLMALAYRIESYRFTITVPPGFTGEQLSALRMQIREKSQNGHKARYGK